MSDVHLWFDHTLSIDAALAACEADVDHPDAIPFWQGALPAEHAVSLWKDHARAWAMHQALQQWRQQNHRPTQPAEICFWQSLARRGKAVEMAQHVRGPLPELPDGVNGILPLMLQAQVNPDRTQRIPRPTQSLRAMLTQPAYQSWARHESLPGVPDGIWGWTLLDRLYLPESGRADLTNRVRANWERLPVEDRTAYLTALLAHAHRATQAYQPDQPDPEPDALRRHSMLWRAWKTVATRWVGVRLEPDSGARVFDSGRLSDTLGHWRGKLRTSDDHGQYQDLQAAVTAGLGPSLTQATARHRWWAATLPIPAPIQGQVSYQRHMDAWRAALDEAGPAFLAFLEQDAQAMAQLTRVPELYTTLRARVVAQRPTSPSRSRPRA